MLTEFIRERADKKGIAVMGHLVCGYPTFEANLEMLEAMDEGGVDVVEFQFPFSEPIADGPLFLTANQVSLQNGTIPSQCFDLLKTASKNFSFKTLMMGYYNTPFAMGEEKFCVELKNSGAAGMIIPDLPIEEAGTLLAQASQNDLSFIPLVAPTNSLQRLKTVLGGGTGFIYAVARKGVTGKKTDFSRDLENYIASIREISPLPLAIGFGIATPEDLGYLRKKADMAVVGTAGLRAFLEGRKSGLAEFYRKLQA